MTRDEIDFTKNYIRRIKVQLATLEREYDQLKDMLYHIEEGILDEEDKYWDKIFQSYQQSKFAPQY